MKGLQAVASGLAGSAALTLIHESARRIISEAPRMDVLGMRAITKSMRKADMDPPVGSKLFWATMAGDIVSNTAYYSLAGLGKGKNVWLRGGLLGLSAGLGAVYLPKPMGLGSQPSGRTPATKLMTVTWYLAGGLVAAAALKLFEKRPEVAELH